MENVKSTSEDSQFADSSESLAPISQPRYSETVGSRTGTIKNSDRRQILENLVHKTKIQRIRDQVDNMISTRDKPPPKKKKEVRTL